MPQKPPIFGPRGPANPSQLIVHANAPIVKIEIILDNRYEPPAITMNIPQNMPASIAMSCLLHAMQSIVAMQIQFEMANNKGQPPAPDVPPDLPPAPVVPS